MAEVVIAYSPHTRRRAEALAWFFQRLGLRVVLREDGGEGVSVKYGGVWWLDPDEAIRHIVSRGWGNFNPRLKTSVNGGGRPL
ncbi:GMP synthase [Aeropyrum globular virus 1]|uniref:GMP synthase n=1 Tax=Aeropyrum globular virus 1 TaxID=1932713 RepID=UPI000C7F00D8|nr:GMP synthase [Aeropyrum globular virus 1]BBC20950.1 GMP synthase [Aeropyrum globular virus 1]